MIDGPGGLVLLEPHRATTRRSALALGAGLPGIVVALAPVPDCQDWREAPLADTSTNRLPKESLDNRGNGHMQKQSPKQKYRRGAKRAPDRTLPTLVV